MSTENWKPHILRTPTRGSGGREKGPGAAEIFGMVKTMRSELENWFRGPFTDSERRKHQYIRSGEFLEKISSRRLEKMK